MPYKRTYRRTYKKRVPRKKSTYGMARRAYAISKRTQYLTKPEAKYREFAGGSLVEDGTPTLVLMNGLVRGTDVGNRLGRVISIKNIELRFRYVINSAATATAVRAILFYDKQPNGALATVNELLAPGPTIPFDGVRNLDYRRRFNVIRDWIVPLSINGDRIKNVHKWINVSLKPQYDNSDNGDITDIQTGALYLILMSNEGTNFPAVTYTFRMRFYDA